MDGKLEKRAPTGTWTAEKIDHLGPAGEGRGVEGEWRTTTHEDVASEVRQTTTKLTQSGRKVGAGSDPRVNDQKRGNRAQSTPSPLTMSYTA